MISDDLVRARVTEIKARPEWWKDYQVTVLEGTVGDFRVQHFRVDEMGNPEGMYEQIKGGKVVSLSPTLPPGRYTKLTASGRVLISDTPGDLGTYVDICERLTGRVLINGLGLGVVVRRALELPEVTHVDIVELSAEVITLVAPTYDKDRRVRVHLGDARNYPWPDDAYWEVVWHDIWSTQSAAHLPMMDAMRERFKDRCTWQGCWQEEWIRKTRGGDLPEETRKLLRDQAAKMMQQYGIAPR